MNIRSLGYRTDLIFPRFDGEVIDRGHYTVIRTPSSPNFYWGNFVLFDSPPNQESIHTWPEIFAREVGIPPAINHIALGWDVVDGAVGDVAPFLERGFHLNETVVLATSELRPPPHYNDDVSIRTFTEDWEWEAAIENQILTRDPRHALDGYTLYIQRQSARYRKMHAAGRGWWFGAFVGDRLVADLGIFHEGTIARYQHVGTHPDFRRRGICGTLVYEAGRIALSTMGVDVLVMLADENYHAARIYESVGFRPVERTRGVMWWRD